MRHWPIFVPITAVVVLAAAWLLETGPVLLAASIVMVIASVLAAVHHAEVVAHRVGEPFGTLVLALAITGDRGRADRVVDAGRRRRPVGARARHDLCDAS